MTTTNSQSNRPVPPRDWPRMGEAVARDFGHFAGRDPQTGKAVYMAGRVTRPGLPGVVYESTPEERAASGAPGSPAGALCQGQGRRRDARLVSRTRWERRSRWGRHGAPQQITIDNGP